MDAAIELKDVNLSLGRGAARVHILKDVALKIRRGEAIGLVGPSGSGKSTLLMTLAGLERPDSGRVVVAGQDLGVLDEDGLARFRGRTIGIVFQSFHLVPTMTALENVAVPLELAGRRDAFAARRRGARRRRPRRPACRIIRRSFPAASSSVSPWRARLAPHPAILVADEPTGNLDEATGAAIVEMMFRLKTRARRDAGAGDARHGARRALRPHGRDPLRPDRGEAVQAAADAAE